MSWEPRNRFWTTAAVRELETGFAITLDDRPLMTPAAVRLVVPSDSLARAIAGEWNAVQSRIRPQDLPFTRAANAAIDKIAPNPLAVIDELASFGETDLLCYRAEEPAALRDRQVAAWDPWLAWSARELSAPLVAISGMRYQPQARASLARLHAAVADHSAFELAALSELVSLSGSLVLGLAVARGAVCAEGAWAISRMDETWQTEQWGLDAEAAAADLVRQRDFVRAETLLVLLGRTA